MEGGEGGEERGKRQNIDSIPFARVMVCCWEFTYNTSINIVRFALFVLLSVHIAVHRSYVVQRFTAV